jgi:hypothetical protein
MEHLKSTHEPPCFGSLTEIMELFACLPYEQFQQTLRAWFQQTLSEKGYDQTQLQHNSPVNLQELVSLIYHQAELKQLLYGQSNSDE